jgi:hypothetical protein
VTTLYGLWYPDYSASGPGSAVYTSRDDAEAVARATQGEVIELALDPPLDEQERRYIRPGEREYHVSMDTDGNGADALELYSKDGPTGECIVCARRFGTSCWATSEKHAIKIANECRGRWLAGGSRTGAKTGIGDWVKAIL